MFDAAKIPDNTTSDAAFTRAPEPHQKAALEATEYLGTATYSPEDNKLRLYPFARLSAQDFQRVKEAGFGWAPKQGLFVAPKWTPARDALLVELCGEVGDEAGSLLERAEERADRFEGYSEKRGAEAEAARQRAEDIGGRFEFGQPILVGHHSERRARKDKERIDGAMRSAVKAWETRDYWEQRARAAKLHADFKQRPDVRYRRLKGIEADLRKALAIVQEAETLGPLWAAEGLTLVQAVRLAERDHMRVAESGKSWGTSGYDLLTREVDAWSVARVAGYAWQLQRLRVATQRPWIAHYEHRIAYERAMLAEDGGLVAEQCEIRVGGRVQVRGQWLPVVRVNRKDGETVSVTTNSRFVRVKGIEEVTAYEAPTAEQEAVVKEAKKLPPLVNYPQPEAVEMTDAEWKATQADYKGSREAGQGASRRGCGPVLAGAEAAPYALHRVRCVVRPGGLRAVFISDAKVKMPPPAVAEAVARPMVPAYVPAVQPLPPVPAAPAPVPEGTESFEAMRRMLKNGGVQTVVASQLFPTPADLAARMVEMAEIHTHGLRVLEPSAGTGNLLRALPGVVPFGEVRQTFCDVVAVEVNAKLHSMLWSANLAQRVEHMDFLECTTEQLGLFDVILMNPPFASAVDILHIEHARRFLAPGGRLVAICAGGPRQAARLHPIAQDSGGSFQALPADTFASSGTSVHTALVLIRG